MSKSRNHALNDGVQIEDAPPAEVRNAPSVFNLKGPFLGFDVERPSAGGNVEKLLSYRPQPKQAFAHNCGCDEIGFGGAVGGGKTYAGLYHCAMHCLLFGPAANTLVLRRTYRQLETSIIPHVLRAWDGKLGKYSADSHVFRWRNGATTWFGHMETVDDKENYQSSQFSFVLWEQLEQFTEEQYRFVFLRTRSEDAHVKPQTFATFNPGGIGQAWIKRRFIEGKEPYVAYEFREPELRLPSGLVIPEQRYRRIFIPSYLEDNEELLKKDPGYLARLRANLSDREYAAYRRGDWDFFEGMAFPEWDENVHVCSEFNVPAHWKVIRVLDWGYSSPFWVGWIAQDPESGTVFVVRELYGAVRGTRGAIKGASMTAPEVRRTILEHEDAFREAGVLLAVSYGVADPSIWSEQGGTGGSVGFELNRGGTLFKRGSKDRVLRKELFHQYLRINEVTGKPRLQVFECCRELRRMMPALPRSEKNPEIVDPNSENHAYDAVGYGLAELNRAPARRRDTAQEWAAVEAMSLYPQLV